MSGLARGARPAMAVAVLVLSALAAVAPASAEPPAHVLDRDMRGEQAIRALGDRLPAVAAENGMTAAGFKASLRAEQMLWVGRSGRLLFVDEFGSNTHGDEHAETAEAGPDGLVAPLADTFELHSRPGASRVVFLDFDGYDATGTAWDGAGSTTIAAPYDSDGNAGSFSTDERLVIQSVWARVAEDFAPFAIDVTTQDPGSAAIRRDSDSDAFFGSRLVVTPSKTYNCSCGGVAYLGVFDSIGDAHDHYQPAWVFTAGVGNGAKNIAEAASHEIGHNLGLSHDGGRGTDYYEGHEDWAPIMGVGYYRPISQWSRGEYTGATNKEDDFTKAVANGAPWADDDHGSTAGALGTSPAHGVIERREDIDAFTFTTTGGDAVLRAEPAAISPNLDIALRLLTTTGTVLAAADPPSSDSSGRDTSIGLGAEILASLPAGTYLVEVSGVGFADPLTTGYSAYGSVGRYTLSLTPGTPLDPPPPDPSGAPAAPTLVDAVANGSVVTVTWADNSTNEAGFEIVRQSLHPKNGTWRSTTVLATTPADATSTTDSPGSGTHRYLVRAYNDAGSTESDWTEVVVDGGGDGGKGGGKGGGKPTKTR